MPIPKGTTVRQVVPVIEGVVNARRLNDDTGEVEYLVAYAAADGEPAERWFLESQIAAVAAPDAGDPAQQEG